MPTGNYLFTGVPAGHYLVHVSDTNAILADFSKSPVVNGIDHVNRPDPYPVYLATAGRTTIERTSPTSSRTCRDRA